MSIVGKALWPLALKRSFSVVFYGASGYTFTIDGVSNSFDSGDTKTVTVDEGPHTVAFTYSGNNISKDIDVAGDCSAVLFHALGGTSETESSGVHNYNGGSKSTSSSKSWDLPADNIAPITKVYIAGQCRVRQYNASYSSGPSCTCSTTVYAMGSNVGSKSSGNYALSYSNGFSGSRYSSYYSASGTKTISGGMTTGQITASQSSTVTESSGNAATYAYIRMQITSCVCW